MGTENERFAIWIEATRAAKKIEGSRDDSVWDIWGGVVWAEPSGVLIDDVQEFDGGLWYLYSGRRQFIDPLHIRRSSIMGRGQPFPRSHCSHSPCFPMRAGLITNCARIECLFQGDVQFEPTERVRRYCGRDCYTRFVPAMSTAGWFGVIRLSRTWLVRKRWSLVAYSVSNSIVNVETGIVQLPMFDDEVVTLGRVTNLGVNKLEAN